MFLEHAAAPGMIEEDPSKDDSGVDQPDVHVASKGEGLAVCPVRKVSEPFSAGVEE